MWYRFLGFQIALAERQIEFGVSLIHKVLNGVIGVSDLSSKMSLTVLLLEKSSEF